MPFDPVNPLESSLMKAAAEPAHRPQFYRDFTQSDIYIPQPGTDPSELPGEIPIEPGVQLRYGFVGIENVQYIPIFTSLPRLQTWISTPVRYFRVNALEFIRWTNAAPLALNLGSQFGKTITAAEAASILDGTIWEPQGAYKVERDTKVLLGQPAEYPTALVERLTRYFQTKPQVTRAWFCLMGTAGPPAESHTLVGVQVRGDYNAILSEMSIVLNDVAVPNPPVDMMPVTGDGGGGLEDYLVKETKPFYTAQK